MAPPDGIEPSIELLAVIKIMHFLSYVKFSSVNICFVKSKYKAAPLLSGNLIYCRANVITIISSNTRKDSKTEVPLGYLS